MKDSKNLARIESIRTEFDKLRALRIRAEADIERSTSDLERLKAQAREELGTDNLDEIREVIRKRDEKNNEEIEGFMSLMAEIRNGISEIEAPQPQRAAEAPRQMLGGIRGRSA